MVGLGDHTGCFEKRGRRFRVLSADAVDDHRLFVVAADDVEHLTISVHSGDDPIDQVRPIESPDQDGRIVESQLPHDVGADLLGGGRGVGVDGGFGEAVLERHEMAILRAEVVAPMADTMGFVNREGAHSRSLDQPDEARREQPLG